MIQSSRPLNKLQFVIVEYGGQTGTWANSVNGNVNICAMAYRVLGGATTNPNLTYNNLTFTDVPCEVVVY